MKFEIPCDAENRLDQEKLIIPLILEPHLKPVFGYLITGAVSLIVGALMMRAGLIIGGVLILLGIMFIILSGYKFRIYNDLKAAYIEKAKEKIEAEGTDLGKVVFEFNQGGIMRIDNKRTRELKWTDFKWFEVKKAHLFLILNPEEGDVVIIGENQIGSESFHQLCELVISKFN